MSVHAEPLLVAVGVIVVGAFFASLAFRLFKLPDTIFLIALGMLLGPTLHWVDVELFEAVAPFIGTVALIVILFEGGLKIRLADLATGVAPGALLAVLVFGATALLCALVAMAVLGMDSTRALLLGMSLGGAGAVVVIPLIQRMEVGSTARTIVSIEAAVSDILVVLAVVGMSTALVLKQTDPTDFVVRLVQNFAIGIVLGVAGGFGWVAALRAFRERSYEYVLTVAILFLIYVGTEFVDGSGPLAVLVFGLVVGNSRKVSTLAEEERRETRTKRSWTYAPVFGEELVSLHHEVIFFLRAFFFVTLGVVVDLEVFASGPILLGGVLLALAVIVGRVWGSTVLFMRSRLPKWDRLSVALMFPLGLAAAVVSLIPSTAFDPPIEGTETFGAFAIVAIVTTNLVAAVLVFYFSQPSVRARMASTPKSTGLGTKRQK